MITKEYLKDKGILIIEESGRITATELLESYREIASRDDYPGDMKVLLNGTQATYGFNINEIPVLQRQIFTVMDRFSSLRLAVIQPKLVERSYILVLERDEKRGDDIDCRFFNNEQTALRWLETSVPRHTASTISFRAG